MQWLISEQAYTKAGLLADVSHDVNELPTLDDMVDIASGLRPNAAAVPSSISGSTWTEKTKS